MLSQGLYGAYVHFDDNNANDDEKGKRVRMNKNNNVKKEEKISMSVSGTGLQNIDKKEESKKKIKRTYKNRDHK